MTTFKTDFVSNTNLQFKLLYQQGFGGDGLWTYDDSLGNTDSGGPGNMAKSIQDPDPYRPTSDGEVITAHLHVTGILLDEIASVELSPKYPNQYAQNRYQDITQTSVSLTTTIIFREGMVQGPPTYLETLDKLDQFSKAQYIPDGQQRLNF